MDIHTVSIKPKNAPLAIRIFQSMLESEKNNILFKNAGEFSVSMGDGITLTGLTNTLRFLSEYATLKGINLFKPTNQQSLTSIHEEFWLQNCCDKIDQNKDQLKNIISKALESKNGYLLGNDISLADLYAFCFLNDDQKLQSKLFKSNPEVELWYKRCQEHKIFQKYLPKVDKKSDNEFLKNLPEIPGAEMNNFVVRFPPEASGMKYNGRMIMRFDDTNPSKENEVFEKMILDDLEKLKIKPNVYSRTSDYFEKILEFATTLITQGNAFVDDTSSEEMKMERAQKHASKCRDNNVEYNLKIWDEMVKGTELGQKYCLRAKIDFQSSNGALRDPTIFRCKVDEEHVATGDKFKCYPTYDFACPIVDSIEGVTHAFRTTEYVDRDDQYYWFIDKLNIRKPLVCSYSRMNLQYTVLSKRKLNWMIENKVVSGWDDPRLPTIKGLLRRGLDVDALLKFVLSQGFSKNVNNMEQDKLWSINKAIMEPVAPRYSAVIEDSMVEVELVNHETIHLQTLQVPLTPNPQSDKKTVNITKKIFIEQEDAKQLRVDEKFTLFNIGNAFVKSISTHPKDSSKIHSLKVEVATHDKNFKGTLKVTWISNERENVKIMAHYFDHILLKPFLKEFDKFEDFVNKDSEKIVEMSGEQNLERLTGGEIIQILRKGFFRCDKVINSGNVKIVHLFSIPDGSKSQSSITPSNGELSAVKKVESQPEQISSGLEVTNESKLYETIVNLGNEIRSLKQNKAEKKLIDEKVSVLLDMKKKFKQIAGKDFAPPTQSTKVIAKSLVNESEKKCSAKIEKDTQVSKNVVIDKTKSSVQGKKITKLGIEAKKNENFSEWYSEIIVKSGMMDYYDISGCYILRPLSYGIWEKIQNYMNKEILKKGVKNCYFPMFTSKAALYKEKQHIADFSPEVAWVTRSGDTELAEPIALRPTSETVMYPAYAKWIQSYRDLPLKLNQWCNIVRWEFKHPTPFLRSREFLWQEGHTAFSNKEDAVKEVYDILELYAEIYEKVLAVPVIRGNKTENEKFPGGDFTTTVEAYVPVSGRGIQGATSHHLGQNFSKMFGIEFEDPRTLQKEFVYQNSWGFTTRSIGVCVMTHSDDKGLVLPPEVADAQVVIVPCGLTASLDSTVRENVMRTCEELCNTLKKNEIRCEFDNRDNISPGWKFNDWELKGVPLRVEIGPKEIDLSKCVGVRRDTNEKSSELSFKNFTTEIKDLLHKIQTEMLLRAKRKMDENIVLVEDMNLFFSELNKKKIILAPHCEGSACEDHIKKLTSLENDPELLTKILAADPNVATMGAKSLCIPLEQPKKLEKGTKCINPHCDNEPKFYVLFGRSY